MENNNLVTIPIDEYVELLGSATRIQILEDMCRKMKYISKDDVKVILGVNDENDSIEEIGVK